MNERIRDLKEQSLLWAIETLDPDALNDNEWGVAIDEKFAELIVKECVELNKQELAFNAFERLLNIYKEHFGVEE